MKKKFSVKGMSCTACVKHVEEAVKSVPGVKTCTVNLTSNTLFAEFDCKEEELFSAVKKAGYGLQQAGEKDARSSFDAVKVLSSFVLLLLLVYVSMGEMWGLPQPSFLKNKLTCGLIQLFLTLPVFLFGYRYFVKGARNLCKGKPTMDSLICVGAGVAFASSIVSLCAQKGEGTLYFESSAMIVTFVSVGKYLEGRSKKKTGDALEKLMLLTPERATVLVDGKETDVPADSVPVGALVIVRQGEKLPCDGTVEKGEGFADESALTGESMPKELKKGEYVLGGTTLLSGYLTIKAVKTGAETTLAGVIESVEKAQTAKPHLARIADRVASFFVPTVMALAVVTFVVWTVIGRLQEGISCAVAVLVVSCPCALGLATPVAVSVGIGKGAKKGILFKTGEAIETLHEAKTFVFDKTGTLTEGKPTVIGCHSYGISEKQLLAIAAGAEKPSSHPLARAICDYAEKEGVALLPATDFSARFGEGVTAAMEGKVYFVGKADYIRETCQTEIPPLSEHTTVCVGEKGKFLGTLELADALRKESKEAVSFLKKKGKKCVLLTGDNEKIARKIGEECGMDEVIAGVLPTQKADVLERYKKQGRTVMVGDGINDAPALTVADVGIAVGGGSDIAIESCDLVLLSGGVRGAVDAYKISCDTVRNIKQNLFWALLYNVLCIPMAAGVWEPLIGWTPGPVLSSAAMSLSSLVVVGNALRYKYIHGGKLIMFGKKTQDGIVLTVEGMMCEHCKARVEKAVQSAGAVGTVDLKKKTVTLSEGADAEAVVKAITDAGYKVKR